MRRFRILCELDRIARTIRIFAIGRRRAGMNVLKLKGHYPKATDVSPWYGIYEELADRLRRAARKE